MTPPAPFLPPLRTGREAPADLVARRTGMTAPPGPAPAGITLEEGAIADVHCYVLAPDRAAGTIVYFHGGGYRLWGAGMFLAWASRLAGRTRMRVVVVDYRLAPEDPFPAAVHDAVAVYRATLAEVDADPERGPVLAAGDSAGGGLAAALVVACVAGAIDPPAAAILLSPWADLTVTASTYATNAETDQLFSFASASEAAEQYLQGHPADDPLASPACAGADVLARFPPTLVLAGGAEVLLDDALTLTAGLTRAGVSVDLHAVAGMPHIWPVMFADRPESAVAIDLISRFVDRVRSAPA